VKETTFALLSRSTNFLNNHRESVKLLYINRCWSSQKFA